MQIQSSTPIHYRPYNLPQDFPVISFVGNNWVPLSVLDNLHFHNCLEVGICRSGTDHIYVENQKFSYQPEDLCVIPANTPHMMIRNTEDSHWEYFAFDPVHFFPEYLWNRLENSDILTSYNPAFPNVLPPQMNEKVKPLVDKIFSEFSRQHSAYKYSMKGLFICLCTEFTNFEPRFPSCISENSVFKIRPALLLIHQFYQEKLTCQDLSFACNLSETHFRRMFKTITALSPMEYLNHFRIYKSCSLLLLHKYSIHEIAQLTGFSTLSSYNRTFHQILSCSPSQWMKQQPKIPNTHQILTLDDEDSSSFFHF